MTKYVVLVRRDNGTLCVPVWHGQQSGRVYASRRNAQRAISSVVKHGAEAVDFLVASLTPEEN